MSAVCVGPMWVLYHLKEYRGEEELYGLCTTVKKLCLISRFSENSERNYMQIN